MKSFVANNNDNGVRLNRFCEKVCPSMPKSLLNKAFRNKRIKVNGKRATPDYRIKVGDLLELYINDEFFDSTGKKSHKEKAISGVKKENFDIFYEDENIIFVFKPFGVLSHSDNKKEYDIVSFLTDYLIKTGEFNPEKENSFTPSICNRLDQGTEGLVICAKNYPSLRDMNEIIKNNLVEKSYLALCNGKIDDGEYTAFLTRDKEAKKVFVSKNKTDNESKEIITIFKTLETKSNLSLIKATLVTGRTHQIRAHLAFLNRPILGDRKYNKQINKALKSQLLSAYSLSFSNIPKENTLSYLSNKSFELDSCFTQEYFEKL